MDLSQRVLQLIEKLFPNFEFVSKFLAENRIFLKQIADREYGSKCNVLPIAISMDSSRQALQTNGFLLSIMHPHHLGLYRSTTNS